MAAHATTIQLSDDEIIRYRWHCSCGASGPAKERIRAARDGAARHVAAMEKR